MFGPKEHCIPRHLAETDQETQSQRISNMISSHLSLSTQNLSNVGQAVGQRTKQVSKVAAKKTKEASKVVKHYAKAGWKVGKTEALQAASDIRTAATEVGNNVREHLSSRSSSSDESQRRSNRRSMPVMMVNAVPVSEHPAFSEGHKLANVPGMHPPSYEQALKDPKEPPSYARPPPSDASGPYGIVERIPYPDFDSSIYDIGGVMEESGPPPEVPKRKQKNAKRAKSIKENIPIDDDIKRLSLTSCSDHTDPGIVSTSKLISSSKKLDDQFVEISMPSMLTSAFSNENTASSCNELNSKTSSFDESFIKAVNSSRSLPPRPDLDAPQVDSPLPPPRPSLMKEHFPVRKVLQAQEPNFCTQRCTEVEFPRIMDNSMEIKIEYDSELQEDSAAEYIDNLLLSEDDEKDDFITSREARKSVKSLEDEFLRTYKFPSLYRVVENFDFGGDDYLKLYKGNFIIVKSISEEHSINGQIFFNGENSNTRESGVFPSEFVKKVKIRASTSDSEAADWI
ncbi:Oidioi.mRNA.OKI2018_I69.chr1.g2157.t1.cds [Oikopleura dioica]|uniref:Oidioi.mRNA.OKI2018_I69.chr1.g2157.t1.cds n=1 Tax=Oikopleura dioica TaxID=34765 RepID=A0ABN7SQ79_OIKDI|nr:Oidioi.mRNA.OKI2018_I69.chr1.g2157.t1.cds [Oikopleura dioica]